MHQSSECHVVYHKMPGNSVASTEAFLLAVMHQNPLSSLTAIYDTDAVVLDAAVSRVTRLTATVCTGGNGVSIICQQSVTIEGHPVCCHSCISHPNVTWYIIRCLEIP